MSRVGWTSAPGLRLTARGSVQPFFQGGLKANRAEGPTRKTKFKERNQIRKRAGLVFFQLRTDLSSRFMAAKVVGSF